VGPATADRARTAVSRSRSPLGGRPRGGWRSAGWRSAGWRSAGWRSAGWRSGRRRSAGQGISSPRRAPSAARVASTLP